MAINDGGPAFQCSMSLRDYFAAQALSSLILSVQDKTREESKFVVVKAAYRIADAMLAERTKEPE